MPLITVQLRDITPVTPRSRLLTLDLGPHSFPFRPGQAVLLGTHRQPLRRPYSIACSPARARDLGGLELLIAVDSNGEPGPHLEAPAAGMRVDVEGPLGTFVYPDEAVERRLLFVAGGTGIAPLRAMIDHVLRREPAPRISLLYSARHGDEFAFIDELLVHEAQGRLELQQTVTRGDGSEWAGRRGRIGRAHFEALLHEPQTTLCFVCGPRAMVAESVATLRTLGVPDAGIRTEAWAVSSSLEE